MDLHRTPTSPCHTTLNDDTYPLGASAPSVLTVSAPTDATLTQAPSTPETLITCATTTFHRNVSNKKCTEDAVNG